MKPIILVGHKHICPIHGKGEVVSGNYGTLVDAGLPTTPPIPPVVEWS